VFEGVAGDDCTVIAGSSVAGELDAARATADADDAVLLTGSLYAVAEARATWTRTVTPVAVDDGDDATALLARANVDPDGIDRSRDGTVHRVVTTRVAAGQATRLREAMLAAGGTCAASGLDNGGQLHDVVLAGTRSEFRTLLADLRTRGHGLPGVADDLAARLDLDGDESPASGTDGESPASETEDYPWDDGTAVMGILNVTPDSFHDGGDFYDVDDAVEQAERLVDAGVEVIDVGGESTRPGADPVPADEEVERIVPVIEAVDEATDALISVDTRKADVAEAALDAGADVLNDVTGLEDPEMRFLAADREVPVIVMHSIDAPVDPSREVEYDDVVADVIDELTERVLLAEKAGIPRERVIVDPGLGFGKSAAESFELLGRLDELHALGCPVLVGHSHKSMFEFVGGETGDALAETIAGSAVAAANGADLIRVHDATENVQAVRVAAAADDPAAFAEQFDG
jgi:dihydropteroate synthase